MHGDQEEEEVLNLWCLFVICGGHEGLNLEISFVSRVARNEVLFCD
jgi:hypothetical protein